MVKISFDLCHPAHYLLFRDVLSRSEEIGFEPLIFIMEKDKLKSLLIEDGLNFYIRYNKKNILSRISYYPKDIIQFRELMKKNNVIANFGKMSFLGSIGARTLNKRSIVFDDTDVAKEQIFLFRWAASEIWCPECYNYPLGSKQHFFKGIFQLAYLHPSVFKPDKSIPNSHGLMERGKPIFIRAINYQAVHDWKYRKTRENFGNVLEKLEKDFDIILVPETGIKYPKKWEKYIKLFSPSDYHHILAFSSLYIGSGASTAGEAAVLGVPSIYTNYETRGFILWLEKKWKMINSVLNEKLKIDLIYDILNKPMSFWKNQQKKLIDYCIDVPKLIEKLIRREIKIYQNS